MFLTFFIQYEKVTMYSLASENGDILKNRADKEAMSEVSFVICEVKNKLERSHNILIQHEYLFAGGASKKCRAKLFA